jgi:hypothetical protein
MCGSLQVSKFYENIWKRFPCFNFKKRDSYPYLRQNKDFIFLPCRLTAEERCDSEGCNKKDQPAMEQQQPMQPLDYQACSIYGF